MNKVAHIRSESTLKIDQLGDISSLLNDPVNTEGAYVEIALDLIDEDIKQPRKHFDEKSLQEMAETIKTRGVKSPISVRPGQIEGRYIINHGARRFRASKLAGRETIPAFVDNDYTMDDQVIENLQRDNLTAREIADFIGIKLSLGVARKIILQKF